jgi:phage tail sheath gpL-like
MARALTAQNEGERSGGAIVQCRIPNACRAVPRGLPPAIMRADAEALNEQITASVALLRRHL